MATMWLLVLVARLRPKGQEAQEISAPAGAADDAALDARLEAELHAQR